MPTKSDELDESLLGNNVVQGIGWRRGPPSSTGGGKRVYKTLGALLLVLLGLVAIDLLVLRRAHRGRHSLPACRKAMYSGFIQNAGGQPELMIWGGTSGHTAKHIGRANTDLWTYSPARGWLELQETNQPTPGRFNGCSLQDENGAWLGIFGGGIGQEAMANELRIFQSPGSATETTVQWKTVFPTASSSAAMTAALSRRAPVCAAHKGKAWIYGGRLATMHDTDSVAVIDVASGDARIVNTVGAGPDVRQGACGSLLPSHVPPDGRASLLVHGGRVGGSGDKGYDDDLWRLRLPEDGGEASWEKVKTTGKVPPERNHHSCAMYGSKFFIFGGRYGRDINRLRGDLWYIDFAIEQPYWSEVTRPSDSDMDWPVPRFLPAVQPMEGHSQLIVFGGEEQNGQRLNDVWTFDVLTGVFKQRQSSDCAMGSS